MKLNWLRAGCASIAECGGVTLCVMRRNGIAENEGDWLIRLSGLSGDIINETPHMDGHKTIEAAEAACEQWLDEHDKPVWHDFGTDAWGCWAEWRGMGLTVRPASWTSVGWTFNAIFLDREHDSHTKAGWYTREQAKSAAEKYVREQTGGAE